MRYGDLKKQVAEMVVAKLEPIQKRYQELMADRGEIHRILRSGAERVSPIAEATIKDVYDRVGLYPR
jgi:tryptophanyl-tRNA synthetase